MPFKYIIIFSIYIVIFLILFFTKFSKKEEFLNKYTPWLLFFFPLEIVSANLSTNTAIIGQYVPTINIISLLIILLMPYYFIVKKKTTKTKATFYFKIFLLINLLSLLFITPELAMGAQKFILYLEMFIVFSLFKRLPFDDKLLIRIIKIIFITFVFQLIITSYQAITGDFDPIRKIFYSQMPIVDRSLLSSRLISGTFGSGVTFAWTMGFYFFMLLPIIFINYKDDKIRKVHKYSFIIILLGLLFTIISATRTSLFFEIFALIIGVFYMRKRFNYVVNFRKVIMLIILSFLLITPLLSISGNLDDLLNRRLSSNNLDDSWQYRLLTWYVAIRAIEAHPIIGIGVGTGSKSGVEQGVLTQYVSSIEKASYDYAGIHQGHLLIMEEVGITGYISYLFFIGAILFYCFRESKNNDYSIIERVFILGGAFITLYLFASDFIGAAFGLKNSSLLIAALWGIAIGVIEYKKNVLSKMNDGN